MSDDNYNELHAWIEPELEARMVAAILGEASDFERDELERLMGERPELRVFRRRLEAVHGLIGEAVKEEHGEEWKLAPKRRAELMATFGGQQGGEEVTVLPAEADRERRIGKAGRRVLAMAAACLLLTLILLPLLTPQVFKGIKAKPEASGDVSDLQEALKADGRATRGLRSTNEAIDAPGPTNAPAPPQIREMEEASRFMAERPQDPSTTPRERMERVREAAPQSEVRERLAELRSNLGSVAFNTETRSSGGVAGTVDSISTRGALGINRAGESGEPQDRSSMAKFAEQTRSAEPGGGAVRKPSGESLEERQLVAREKNLAQRIDGLDGGLHEARRDFGLVPKDKGRGLEREPVEKAPSSRMAIALDAKKIEDASKVNFALDAPAEPPQPAANAAPVTATAAAEVAASSVPSARKTDVPMDPFSVADREEDFEAMAGEPRDPASLADGADPFAGPGPAKRPAAFYEGAAVVDELESGLGATGGAGGGGGGLSPDGTNDHWSRDEAGGVPQVDSRVVAGRMFRSGKDAAKSAELADLNGTVASGERRPVPAGPPSPSAAPAQQSGGGQVENEYLWADSDADGYAGRNLSKEAQDVESAWYGQKAQAEVAKEVMEKVEESDFALFGSASRAESENSARSKERAPRFDDRGDGLSTFDVPSRQAGQASGGGATLGPEAAEKDSMRRGRIRGEAAGVEMQRHEAPAEAGKELAGKDKLLRESLREQALGDLPDDRKELGRGITAAQPDASGEATGVIAGGVISEAGMAGDEFKREGTVVEFEGFYDAAQGERATTYFERESGPTSGTGAAPPPDAFAEAGQALRFRADDDAKAEPRLNELGNTPLAALVPGNAGDDPFMDLEPADGGEDRARKLRSIVIPRVDIEDATVDDVVAFLKLQTTELDPSEAKLAEENLDIILMNDEADAGAGLDGKGKFGAGDLGAARIKNLKLENATVEQVLEEVGRQASLGYRFEAEGVTLHPLGADEGKGYVTKTFQLPPVFLSDIAEAGDKPASGPVSMIKDLRELGVEFDEGAYAVYHPGSSTLTVRNTEAALEQVERVTAQAHHPDPAARQKAALGDEKTAEAEPFSTFSLHVSDVSFKLAHAALARGEWPEAERVRIEEFVNALDYGDPSPSVDEKVACQVEQAVHPFLQQRNLLRVSMRTAALGRNAGTPLRLTLLLDNSGSMDRADRVESVQSALRLLAAELNPQDEVTLLSFARTPRLLREGVKGDQAAALVDVVRQTPSEGGTNLESALRLGLEKAKDHFLGGAQNRVILLTDGAANLGNAEPAALAGLVETMRQEGIAFDACGVGAEGLNDEILESLTRKGDGRYYFLDRPEDADAGFAKQIAGALRPAAKNVKVQVEFNPKRVGNYKLLGFEKHRLEKEDFRNDSVDAAEMAAEEEGVAVYQFEAMPEGEGDVGSVSVRFRDMDTGRMVERNWTIPYEAQAARVDEAGPSIQLAASAAMLAEKLKGSAAGELVNLGDVERWTRHLQTIYPKNTRVRQLLEMTIHAREMAP